MDNDTSWCPVCDRQIQPKRFLVPVAPPPIPAPAPPPSSPHSPALRRSTKNSGTIRQRPGLVNGTGRLKPNGSLRQSKSPVPAPPPLKHRVVIDQGPTPLYCSDECQMADINHGLPHNFHPDREPRSFSPVSFSSRPATDSDSACSSVESQSSVESTHIAPSLAKLAAMYNFPPFPPPAPVDDEDDIPTSCNVYSSGIMMASRRITEELLPGPRKRDDYGRISREPRKPIPGWTDGSNAWRNSIYSLSAAKPQQSFAARSSIGVPSTATSPSFSRSARHSTSLPPKTSESDSEMLHRFSSSFTHCASRASVASSAALRSSSSSASSFSTMSPTKRDRSLVRRGAEGKLLVPDVIMRVSSSASTTSLSSDWSATSSRKSLRSPLSRASTSFSEDDFPQRCDSASSLPHASRPTVESEYHAYWLRLNFI